VILAISGTGWVQVIVALSIFVPVIVVIWLTWIFLRGKSSDPDEQRWRRLEQQRREAEKED
jgi:uncharacterized paraquat-inducible protein A